MTKLNKNDYLLLLGIVLILLVGIFLISYYFNIQNNECFNNPLVYGAKQLEDKTTGSFSGMGYLKNDLGLTIIMMHFNSTDYKQESIIH